jgi:ribonuclease J
MNPNNQITKEKLPVEPAGVRNVVLPDGRMATVPRDLNGVKIPAAEQAERVANQTINKNIVRVIPLGGQEKGGGNNMIVIEYGNDAIVTDAGHNLGIELPGVNYSIPDTTYLEKIKHKVRGYVFTHGHLDHIGAVPHIVPKIPAPVYGSRFTIGMVQKEFEDMSGLRFKPQTVILNLDSHDRVKVGAFTVELVRVTHSIPESTAIVIDTPVGRIINTGDFRLDPEPLDRRPTDVARLAELGKAGVLLLMAESTTTERAGRTPTEDSLKQTFYDLFARSRGRVLVASFASNVNRVQMIIDAAVKQGRKASIIGRSMLAHVELAVKLGILKVPAGTIVRTGDIARLPDDQVTIICTGGQGEEFAALSRMARGDHANIKIKPSDTVIFSSTPIPFTGNDESIRLVVDDLMRLGATVYRHETHGIDNCGPLHVSGHASMDEFADMIKITKPKYFMPIYGDFHSRKRYVEIAVKTGLPKERCSLIDNGDVLEVSQTALRPAGQVPAGNVVVDNTGQIVPGIVIKDRLGMMDNGILVVVLTMNAATKQLITSPDIITRGFIQVSESQELMNELRTKIKAVAAKTGGKDLDKLKVELRDQLSNFIYKKTKQNPIVISVVNLVDAQGRSNARPKPQPDIDHS